MWMAMSLNFSRLPRVAKNVNSLSRCPPFRAALSSTIGQAVTPLGKFRFTEQFCSRVSEDLFET